MDVLREQVHTLKERFSELTADFKRFADEMKDYRHSVRAEYQRVEISIERLSQEVIYLEKEMKQVHESISAIVSRIDVLDRQKFQVQGGIRVVHWIWGGVAALILLAADAAIRKMAG